MTLTFKKHIAFVKDESKVGEPDCHISVITCGCQDLVAIGQVVQFADHDFVSLTLIPTVVLSHDVPGDIN